MQAVVHQIVLGLATGGVYGALALALVMIFKSTHHLNFAQGELAMFTTYIGWSLVQAGVPYWAAFTLTLVAAFVLGAGIQILIVRRVQHAPVLTAVIVYIGLSIVLNGMAGWIFQYTIRPFPSPFAAAFDSAYFSAHEVGVAFVTLLTLSSVYAFFQYTASGWPCAPRPSTRSRAAWSASASSACSHSAGDSPLCSEQSRACSPRRCSTWSRR
jgi:branched-chain amino acid transport system permease protein